MIIDQHLKSNYEKAHYLIGKLGICLLVHEHNPALDVFLLDNNAQHWAIITAYNPSSQIIDNQLNNKSHLDLCKRLDEAGKVYFPAVNRDPSGDWPDEKSLIVLDIIEEVARDLAASFGQNALLYGQMGQAARLVWSQKEA